MTPKPRIRKKIVTLEYATTINDQLNLGSAEATRMILERIIHLLGTGEPHPTILRRLNPRTPGSTRCPVCNTAGQAQ